MQPSAQSGAPHTTAPPVQTAPDRAAVEHFLAALARALQRHQRYPPTSPLCAESDAACHRTLGALVERDQIALRATPRALLVDERPMTLVAGLAADLIRRLIRAGVAEVTLDRTTSARDLSRFCRELVARDAVDLASESLADALLQMGIEKIQVTPLRRPAVLPIGAPPEARLALVEREQARRAREQDLDGAVPLYPPGKGWVRLDPASPLRAVALADLAMLVEDPSALAVMLTQLTDDSAEAAPEDALSERFEEIAGLVSSLDPPLAETLFSRLASAVLAMPEARRHQLLRDTVLPGLLEGRLNGRVLRHFPDMELADSLALLLDLQTAAPEFVAMALDRLDLSPARREAMEPLLKARLALADAETPDPAAEDLNPGTIDGYADGRLSVSASPKDFKEFVGVDLAMTVAARRELDEMAVDIHETDEEAERIRCLVNLLHVERNPAAADGLLARLQPLLGEFAARADWTGLSRWMARLRDVAAEARDERPEIAEAAARALASAADERLVQALIDLADGGAESRQAALGLLGAFDAVLAPGIVALLEAEESRPRRHTLTHLLSEHRGELHAALVPGLNHPLWFVARNLAYVLGHGGPGPEDALAGAAKHRDDRVAREALRALGRIGSPAALAHIVAALDGPRQAHAEEAFWRCPAALSHPRVCALLADRAFAAKHPALARRLLARAADSHVPQLGDVRRALAPLRLHFWRPALMRLGFDAARIGGDA